MQYTKVPATTFSTLQMNAGIMVSSFVPSTGVIGDILGATTGGLSFNTNPEYEDFGEDIDNVPANTKQLKRIKSYDPTISGTFLTMTKDTAKMLSGAGAFDSTDTYKFVPTHTLASTDFTDVWIVGDYSDKNEGATAAGFIAIHIIDALNTAGFQWQTTKDGKGQFAFEFHGHYDIEDMDTVPYEIYIKEGTT